MSRSLKTFFAQFGSTVLLVGLCVYLIVQLTLGIGEVVDTENTTFATVTDSVRLEAYLFRDEKPLYSGTTGTNSYLAESGAKVVKGETVAVTYLQETDAGLQEKITRIDRMIRILEQSGLKSGAITTDLSVLDKNIEEMTVEMLREIADGDLFKAQRGEESLLIEMNRRQSLLGSDGVSFATRINVLKQEKADLERSLQGESVQVIAPDSGYFYSGVDGYEGTFTMEALADLTVERFRRLTESEPDNRILQNACGKLVSNAEWSIAVATDRKTAAHYTVGRSYSVSFPYSGGLSIRMSFDRRLMQTDSDTEVLIFSCRQLPEGFDFSRNQTVQLSLGEYEGIRVHTSALRVLDGEVGCYVLDGTRVVFKKADVIYRNDEYTICRIPENPVTERRTDRAYISPEYLSLYDTVILSGTDLYVGKTLQ